LGVTGGGLVPGFGVGPAVGEAVAVEVGLGEAVAPGPDEETAGRVDDPLVALGLAVAFVFGLTPPSVGLEPELTAATAGLLLGLGRAPLVGESAPKSIVPPMRPNTSA
jgi:hypothetical protein